MKENHLKDQTSPYLLQHAENPVNWYPWCEEAFTRAKEENKPIFLSIGYSTCHWCHVMAHESFEDEDVAKELNQHFISIKVDKEERPDIDSVYMEVCVMLTGSGGWPTSIFLTPEQKPFYAGTYFPKYSAYGGIGFLELLQAVSAKWKQDKNSLLQAGEEITRQLQVQMGGKAAGELEEIRAKKAAKEPGELENSITAGLKAAKKSQDVWQALFRKAVTWFWRSFDPVYGGFGNAPKFPMPHNLMFLMEYYRVTGDGRALEMAEKTLVQMYCGGIFDHIGYGFSRYSTDASFLVPHFEKMLYDNALLLMSYTQAYSVTHKEIYREVAQKTAQYILDEMTAPGGGFYSAQDADSEGVEGKYYVFGYEELLSVLGASAGKEFNEYFNITREGNFEGKNIPNLLDNGKREGKKYEGKACAGGMERESKKYAAKACAGGGEEGSQKKELEESRRKVYEYRKGRCRLHLDDKILTSWNGWMIGAFAGMYRVLEQDACLQQARAASDFMEKQAKAARTLRKEPPEGDSLFVSYRAGKCQGTGFLDDYAFYAFGLIELYRSTLEQEYLEKAIRYVRKAVSLFKDRAYGGYFLYGKENESLIAVPKEAYDGAIPSGNSVMAYDLVKLWQITGDTEWKQEAEEQLRFLSDSAGDYPAGQSFFLLSCLLYQNPPEHIVCVLKEEADLDKLKEKQKEGADIVVLREESREYPMINDRTTLYICSGHSCKPPVNF